MRITAWLWTLLGEKGKGDMLLYSYLPQANTVCLCRLAVHRGQVTLPCHASASAFPLRLPLKPIFTCQGSMPWGCVLMGRPLDDAHYSRWVSPLSTPFFKNFFADIKKCRQTLGNTGKNFFKKSLKQHLNGCAERTKTAKTIHAALQGICLKFNIVLNLSIG